MVYLHIPLHKIEKKTQQSVMSCWNLKNKIISNPIIYNVIVSVNAAHDVVPDISLGYSQNADITKVQCKLIVCQHLCDGVQTWNIQTGSHTK